MKHSSRTTQLALLGGALLGTAWLSPAAKAKPFPKKGYILQGKSSAEIGRRSSSLEGERAALRMMARLIRWNPHEKVGYDVGWSFLDSKGKLHQSSMAYANANTNDYNPDPTSVFFNQRDLTIFGDDYAIYVGVTPQMFRRAARSNGSLRDLLRYGTFDALKEEVN